MRQMILKRLSKYIEADPFSPGKQGASSTGALAAEGASLVRPICYKINGDHIEI